MDEFMTDDAALEILGEFFAHLDSIVIDGQIGLGDNFDDLAELSFDIDDWDETGGEWVFENTMNKIDAEMFADVDKVEQGGNAVLCTMGDVRDVAQYLMSDAHSGVAYYIPSWLPSSADVNPVEETMSYMISFVPTAEFES